MSDWLDEMVVDRPPEHRETSVPRPVSGGCSPYGEQALTDEVRRVQHAPKGERNATLNVAAYSLGQLVAGGEINETLVVDQLTSAARTCGLGKREIRRTIASGLRKGKAQPRTAPPREHQPPRARQMTRDNEEQPDPATPEAIAVVRNGTLIEISPGDLPPEPAPIQWITAADMAEPLLPVDWVVRDLGLAAGRPNLLFGKPGSVKTILAQYIGLAVATGAMLLGQFPTRPGTVAHLDYDQGRNATKRRYQRIAAAQGIDLLEVGDRLRMQSPPDKLLTDKDAEAWLRRALTGVRLAILDCMIGACPGQDENDTRIAQYLHLLWRVSEATLCAILLLHHSGKDLVGAERDPRDAPRGSSAIMGATGCAIHMSGPADKPRLVLCAKPSVEGDGHPFEAFYIRPHAVQIGDDPNGGLGLDYLTAEQAKPPKPPGEAFEQLKRNVLELVRSKPGELKSKTAIARRVTGGNKQDRLAAAQELIEEGAIKLIEGGFRVTG